ncbi:hypothetical protein [Pseudomonas sp. GXZC]|uniref:hypothetical protein n=1 Tax=Pseudomonas sp. GXZC TaxID=3003351 RepID=UPI0022AA4D95|nr:hypothetical protein [Pseudomonas sp. GXZC]WAT32227.1 hypothetical protein OZ428_33655 [Pseudomonas sp. GXZC]
MADTSSETPIDLPVLLAQIDDLRVALTRWKSTQEALLQCCEKHHAGGWIFGEFGLKTFQRRSELPAELRRALCSLDVEHESAFRVTGAVFLPAEASASVFAAETARAHLNAISIPLRKLKRADLSRLPTGMELGGGQLSHWITLRPKDGIWKAVIATVGEPRIRIRYAVRPLMLEGARGNTPRKISFCKTIQHIVKKRHPTVLIEALERIMEEEGERHAAAQRDVSRLTSLMRLSPIPDLAYIYRGGYIYHVNLAWSDGERLKVKTSLPLFICGEGPDIPPLSSSTHAKRQRRSDVKYADVPLLETQAIYCSIR